MIVRTYGHGKTLADLEAADTLRVKEKDDLIAHVRELEGELSELLNESFRALAFYIDPKSKDASKLGGWWDSQARGDVCDLGDRLVELGLWERHPDGYGRAQFYRPLRATETPRANP